MNHLNFISIQSELTFDQLKVDSFADADNNQLPYVYKVTEEEVKLGGSIKLIRRVFIQSDDSGKYAKLGWVLLNDVDCCMVCAIKFKGLLYNYHKYHCHACGNVVCNVCSDNYPTIKELDYEGGLKVCNFCFFGQVSSNTYSITNILVFPYSIICWGLNHIIYVLH